MNDEDERDNTNMIDKQEKKYISKLATLRYSKWFFIALNCYFNSKQHIYMLRL
jgi:hypothetical protein